MRQDFGVLTYLLHLVPAITRVFDPELAAFVTKSKVGLGRTWIMSGCRGVSLLVFRWRGTASEAIELNSCGGTVSLVRWLTHWVAPARHSISLPGRSRQRLRSDWPPLK